jgi:hypothetical protein
LWTRIPIPYNISLSFFSPLFSYIVENKLDAVVVKRIAQHSPPKFSDILGVRLSQSLSPRVVNSIAIYTNTPAISSEREKGFTYTQLVAISPSAEQEKNKTKFKSELFMYVNWWTLNAAIRWIQMATRFCFRTKIRRKEFKDGALYWIISN